MRRASLAGALIALMLLVAPVVAHHKDGHSGGPPSGVQKDKDEDNDDGGSQGRFSADSAEDCEDGARNHGQYVSCIVHLVHGEGGGGDVEAEDIGLEDDCDDYPNLIACAANSDVGKDENDEESRAADQDNDDNEDNEDNED